MSCPFHTTEKDDCSFCDGKGNVLCVCGHTDRAHHHKCDMGCTRYCFDMKCECKEFKSR
jgi:hypothetical protein